MLAEKKYRPNRAAGIVQRTIKDEIESIFTATRLSCAEKDCVFNNYTKGTFECRLKKVFVGIKGGDHWCDSFEKRVNEVIK